MVFAGAVPEPCNETWTIYKHSNMFGGSRLPSADSVTSCLQGCKVNRRCRGADYNSANPVGWRCYLQFAAIARINMGKFSGISHYSLTRICPGTLSLALAAYSSVVRTSVSDRRTFPACARTVVDR